MHSRIHFFLNREALSINKLNSLKPLWTILLGKHRSERDMFTFWTREIFLGLVAYNLSPECQASITFVLWSSQIVSDILDFNYSNSQSCSGRLACARLVSFKLRGGRIAIGPCIQPSSLLIWNSQTSWSTNNNEILMATPSQEKLQVKEQKWTFLNGLAWVKNITKSMEPGDLTWLDFKSL